MAKIKPRVKVPKKAAAGEIIEIKALISHPMHTGGQGGLQATRAVELLLILYK